MKQKNDGFTLIDPIVVIAMIAFLASILIPVVTKVRSVGKGTECASNLHQSGILFQTFIHDTGTLPLYTNPDQNLFPDHARGWLLSVYGSDLKIPKPIQGGYAKGILVCPSLRKYPDEWIDRSQGYNFYDYNGYGIGGPQGRRYAGLGAKNSGGSRIPVKLEEVKNPSSTVMMGDAVTGRGNQLADGGTFCRTLAGATIYKLTQFSSDRCLKKHDKGVNVLHVDGHQSRIAMEALFSGPDAGAAKLWNRNGE